MDPEIVSRQDLLAFLSLERASLLHQIVGLNEAALEAVLDEDGWTTKGVLVHVAAWDDLNADRLSQVLAGQEEQIVGVTVDQMHERNARLLAESASLSGAEALAACLTSRARFMDLLALVPDQDLFRPLRVGWGDLSVARMAQLRGLHDGTHDRQVRAWRRMQDLPWAQGQKARYLAHLLAERADLLAQLVDLEEADLVGQPVLADASAKDVLAHVAFWDRWVLSAMQALQAGQQPDQADLQDVDATNARVAAAWADRSLLEVLGELQEARAAWLAWLTLLPEAEFVRAREVDGEDWSFPGLTEVQWQHDAEHAGHIAAWRERARLHRDQGPKALLLAALDAARRALLAAASLNRPGERSSGLILDQWTLKDLLGHIADWEAWVLDALSQMAQGQEPAVEAYESIQSWNDAHAAARRAQSWDQVWQDFSAIQAALLAVLEEMSQDALERPFPAPWSNQPRAAYAWLRVILLDHDLEHTHDLTARLFSRRGQA